MKRADSNDNPFNLYVELLLTTDLSIYTMFQAYTKLTDQNTLFLYMKIYYAQFINGVT